MDLRGLVRRLNGSARVEARFDRVGGDLRGRLDEIISRSDEDRARREAVEERLATLTEEIAQQRERLDAAHRDLRNLAQLSLEDEPRARRRLNEERSSRHYLLPFESEEPLVSVVIPTYQDVIGLTTRAVPSVLSQTYSNVEVLVIGDGAPAETERALGELADQRVTYENLNRRGPYPGDRRAFWQTAGIPALNRGIFLARGEWFAILNDDDAYRPDFIEALLAIAMADRLEVAYGKLRHHEPNNASWDLGSFPPEDHKFGWQMALQHRSMRMFEYELAAYVFDEPGDWNRARRMLRAGVRFGMLDAVVGDYWPSALWKTSG